jgi:hypothetical protein
MPSQDKNKPTRKSRLRTLISGVQKQLSGSSLALSGQTLSADQLVLRIQQDIDLTDAATLARTAWIEKVQLERNSHQELAPLLRALRSLVFSKFGDTNNAASVLGEFGFAPRKVAQRPSATKAGAAVKSRATRSARHTMGKRQKAGVKGDVKAVGTAPAAAPPPAKPT